MLHRMNARWMVALLAGAAAACTDNQYQLVLLFPDQALFERARHVDLFLGAGSTCDALRASKPAPTLSYDPHGTLPALGNLPFGRTAFLADVRAADCTLFLDGCVLHELQPRQDATIRIGLLPVNGAACAADQRCMDGVCLAADGGVSDAATNDRGDGAVADASGGDHATDAAIDAAIADASGRDLVADAAAADRIDAAVPDQIRFDQAIPLNCGNGSPDDGEDCDDGSGVNGNLALSCCTAQCHFAGARTACGNGVCHECPGTSAQCQAVTAGPSPAGCNGAATECAAAESCDSNSLCQRTPVTTSQPCTDTRPLDCHVPRCDGQGGCDQFALDLAAETACAPPGRGYCDSVAGCQWPRQGDGLAASYFRTLTLSGSALTRIDATVDFRWGYGAPDPSLPDEIFSVRWSGDVEPEHSETYTFYTTSDDGMRLWVDEQLVIDDWTHHSMSELSGQIDLVAGHRTSIVLEYFEDTGIAGAILAWSSPSRPKQVIPQQRLHSTRSQLPIYMSDLAWASASNGYGPVERDTSNGETAAGDGVPISINGVAYAKGLGTHAAADIAYDLSGMNCSRFAADVGVDAEMIGSTSTASVVFEVWSESDRLYQSGVLSQFESPTAIHLDIEGAQQLHLVVTDGGDGISADHADWADARIYCTDLAFNRPFTVSSEEPGQEAPRALDGDSATRWASAVSDPQSLTVDLGRSHDLTRLVLLWEDAFASAYSVQVSDDGNSWTDLYSTSAGDGGIDDLTGLTGRGRYLRWTGTGRGTSDGYSLWEIYLFGDYAGPICGNGATESGEACDGSACCDGSCGFIADGVSTTGCSGGTGECSDIDSCDGAGHCLSRDLPTTTSCTDVDNSDCQLAYCDGAGSCGPGGVALANGQSCSPPSGGSCLAGICYEASASGLVAAYAFDEGSGSAITDFSGTGNGATVSGASWSIDGRFQGALACAGAGAGASAPNSASLDVAGTQLTVMAWVWIDPSSPADQAIVEKPWTEGAMDSDH